MKTLTECANRHGCDRGTTTHEAHGYSEVYEQCMWRDRPFRLLEIGIGNGSGIRMWKEWNPQINLTVIDVDPSSLLMFHPSQVEAAHIADQGDRLQIASLCCGVEPFDVIIDDGSHAMREQQISLAVLLPMLRSGGRYFIEDLQTCHWFDVGTRTSDLLRELSNYGNFASPYLTGEECNQIKQGVASVTFWCGDKLAELVKR